MQLYKEMTMESVMMHETIRQIHESAGDARWRMEGIVPVVTSELVIQCARNQPIDVMKALDSAANKLQALK
ncbi:hypothetical protein BLSTO_06004 [Blastocystis sp. subtype 1]